LRFLFLVYGIIILFGVTFYTIGSTNGSSSGSRSWGSSGGGWSSGGGGHK